MKLWRLHQIEGFILKDWVPPLWPTYKGWKEDNICQSIWDKSEVLWRTCWGTYWEPVGNLNGKKWKSVLIFYFGSWPHLLFWFSLEGGCEGPKAILCVQLVSRMGFFVLFWVMNQSKSFITKRQKLSKLYPQN
jgi:hypothetical protein